MAATIRAPGRRARRRTRKIAGGVRRHLPEIALSAVILAYVAVHLTQALATYLNNGYSGYDLGKNAQSVWLISRLQEPFNTIRGLNMLGDHMSLAVFLIAPVYWVWPSPAALLTLNVVLRGVGAYFLYLAVVRKLGSRWAGFFFAAILLFNPEYGNAALDHFYPESLASPLLILAFYLLQEERYRQFYLVSAVIMSVKEDAPLIVFAMCLYHLVFAGGSHYLAGRRRQARHAAASMAAAMAVSLLYFLVAIQVVAHFSGGTRGLSDGNYFSGFMENRLNPSFYAARLGDPQVRAYLDSVFGPLSWLPLLSPQVSLICLPSLLFNIVTPWPYARNIAFHYSVYVTPFLVLGVVDAYARLGGTYSKHKGKAAVRWGVAAAFIILSFLILRSTVEYNGRLAKIPLRDYPTSIQRNVNWYLSNEERTYVEAAESMIPPGANVSVDPFLATGLSGRSRVYQFTNPWRLMYYGSGNVTPPDPASVEYVLLKYMVLKPDEKAMADGLVSGGQFEVAYSEGGNIRLLKRVRSPG
jgi:uncharacterized membrane protein